MASLLFNVCKVLFLGSFQAFCSYHVKAPALCNSFYFSLQFAVMLTSPYSEIREDLSLAFVVQVLLVRNGRGF